MDSFLCVGGPRDGQHIDCRSEFFVVPAAISAEQLKDIIYKRISLADGNDNIGEPPKYFYAFIAQDGDERGIIERLLAGYKPSA